VLGFSMVLFFSSAQTSEKEKKRSLPQVDFPLEDQQNLVEIDPERKKKNAGYDKLKLVQDPKGLDIIETEIKSHWYLGFPAIPTAKSNLVMSGKVTKAKAFLSNDKTGIYSEFEVEIEKIIKNNDKSTVSIGETIQVERIGGQVRFPSSQVVKYMIYGQGLPQEEKNYIFFLSYDAQRQSYRIVTAYEIRKGRIYALDGNNAVGGDVRFSMDEFNGYEETLFIDKINKSLSSPNSDERKVSAP
jgi:hypothetical protein